MIKLSAENLQSYVRIALYHVGAWLMVRGYGNAGTWEMWGGVVLNGLTFMWTLWGQRVIAKINELSKIPNLIVIAPPAISNASPATNVVSTVSQAQSVAVQQAANPASP